MYNERIGDAPPYSPSPFYLLDTSDSPNPQPVTIYIRPHLTPNATKRNDPNIPTHPSFQITTKILRPPPSSSSSLSPSSSPSKAQMQRVSLAPTRGEGMLWGVRGLRGGEGVEGRITVIRTEGRVVEAGMEGKRDG